MLVEFEYDIVSLLLNYLAQLDAVRMDASDEGAFVARRATREDCATSARPSLATRRSVYARARRDLSAYLP